MENPKVSIPKLQETVMRNLAKIFPNDIEDFKIHIVYKGTEKILVPDEKDVITTIKLAFKEINESLGVKVDKVIHKNVNKCRNVL